MSAGVNDSNYFLRPDSHTETSAKFAINRAALTGHLVWPESGWWFPDPFFCLIAFTLSGVVVVAPLLVGGIGKLLEPS